MRYAAAAITASHVLTDLLLVSQTHLSVNQANETTGSNAGKRMDSSDAPAATDTKHAIAATVHAEGAVDKSGNSNYNSSSSNKSAGKKDSSSSSSSNGNATKTTNRSSSNNSGSKSTGRDELMSDNVSASRCITYPCGC